MLAVDPKAIYGEPLAPGMMRLLQNEIVTGLRTRGVADDFIRFQHYAGSRLDATAGLYTGSELTGNCRLSWYDHLLRNPLKAPAEAEEFTRLLHKSIVDDPSGLGPVLATAAEKLDLGMRKPRRVRAPWARRSNRSKRSSRRWSRPRPPTPPRWRR